MEQDSNVTLSSCIMLSYLLLCFRKRHWICSVLPNAIFNISHFTNRSQGFVWFLQMKTIQHICVCIEVNLLKSAERLMKINSKVILL